MRQFLIKIVATGNHGCDRHVQSGGKLHGCHKMGCVDCRTREFLKTLQREASVTVERAELVHWPGTVEEVTDDLRSGARQGSFKP